MQFKFQSSHTFKVYITLAITFLSTFYLSAQGEMGMDERIDKAFEPISDAFQAVVFYEVAGIPLVVILLVSGALFFTLYFGFINIRKFPLAINVVRGKYDELEKTSTSDEEYFLNVDDGDIVDTIRDESQDGEVSHFQALATAVSGTVGNGNIAGVALAIALGGPGATFWMIVCGLLGMSTKFVECTLGVAYRDIDENGTVFGGPMYYLSRGLKEKGFTNLGKVLAVVFSVLCVGASFGGGNAAQSNQAAAQMVSLFNMQSGNAGTIVGVLLAVLVGIIIIGGIKRIASVTEKIVPLMAGMYVLACLYIIFANYDLVGYAFSQIFTQAFTPEAGIGGFLGVLILGFRRAAFSNEAGAGSSPIAHAAVKTKFAASEGLVALLEPFIDTVVICTMTALVIIIFNYEGHFAYGGDGGVYIDNVYHEGAGLTSKAFAAYIPFSDVFLAIAVFLFAVSTMISWSYYGLQSWFYLFGRSKINDLIYKLLFLAFIVIGAAANMSSIWGFSDAMILAMVFPNMIGLFILFPVVKERLNRYITAINTQNK